jgi:hypothetical protein
LRWKEKLGNFYYFEFKLFMNFREAQEESILNILEETCNKLNSAQII